MRESESASSMVLATVPHTPPAFTFPVLHLPLYQTLAYISTFAPHHSCPTPPVPAAQLKSLERQLHGRLDTCCAALEALGMTLAEVARMEKQDTKNPFSGEPNLGGKWDWDVGH